MHLQKVTFAILTTCALLLASAGMAQDTPHWQRLHLGFDNKNQYDFPVYANQNLSLPLPNVHEVIIVQHGIQRNGDDYFASAMQLLKNSGRNPNEILIIAPNFPGIPDKDKGFDNMPVWSVQGWTGGENAVKGVTSKDGLSSLTVLDDILLMLTNKKSYPALQKITIAGHSGGAQLVHRYAALNHVDEQLRQAGMDLQYVIANPSSYLYFTPQRPQGNGFATYDLALCPAFDDYRYGMQHMVPYAGTISGQDLFQRYLQRHVTYLAGTADNDPNHRVLDKSCGAEAEGSTRISRARGYWLYEYYLAGKQSLQMHQRYEVLGVGHNQEQMFGSQCGTQLLFGSKATTAAKAASCNQIAPGAISNNSDNESEKNADTHDKN